MVIVVFVKHCSLLDFYDSDFCLLHDSVIGVVIINNFTFVDYLNLFKDSNFSSLFD